MAVKQQRQATRSPKSQPTSSSQALDVVDYGEDDVAEVGQVVTNRSTEIVVESKEYQAIATYFWDEYPAVAENTGQVQVEIIGNLLELSGLDVLDSPESLDSAGKWAHKPIRLMGIVQVIPSTFHAGAIYARCSVVDLVTGETETINVGSPTMLAQLKALSEAKAFPLECKIVPVKRSREGRNPPLYFRRLNYTQA